MSKCRTPIYDYRTEKIRNFLMGTNKYSENKILKSENGIPFYINSKGYFHILKVKKTIFNDEKIFYIEDFLLKKDNELSFVATSKFFSNIEQTQEFIENWFN